MQNKSSKHESAGTGRTFDCRHSHDPEFAREERRLESFKNWKGHPKVNRADMAASGMVCKADADRTYCFHCALALRNWESHDDPLIEHARFNPNCEFLIFLVGVHFIASSLEFYEINDLDFNEKRQHFYMYNSSCSVALAAEGMVQRTPGDKAEKDETSRTRPKRIIRRVEPREIRSRLDTDQVKMLMNLGYPRELVGQIIGEHLQTEADDFKDFAELARAVINGAEMLGMPVHYK